MDYQLILTFIATAFAGYQVVQNQILLRRGRVAVGTPAAPQATRWHRYAPIAIMGVLVVLAWIPYLLGHVNQPVELSLRTSSSPLVVGQRASMNVHFANLGPGDISDFAHAEFCGFVQILDFNKKPIADRMKVIEYESIAALRKKVDALPGGLRIRSTQRGSFLSFLECPVLEKDDFQMDGNIPVLRRDGMMLLAIALIRYSDAAWPFSTRTRYARHCLYFQNNAVGQVPETLDNRGADALDGARRGKISGVVR